MTMSTQELIENAVLDAHGLLEEAEHADFERSLAAAPPQVQATVRREQTRLADLEDLLPKVEPPIDLRRAVIERVREEMARSLVEADGSAPRSGSLSGLEFIPSKKVSPVWRMVAVTALAAAVALAFGFILLQDEVATLEQTNEHNAMLDEIAQSLGSRYVNDMLFDPHTERVIFTPTARTDGTPATRAEASLFFNPDWTQARLFCMNLDADDARTYRLAIVDETGRVVEELHAFQPASGLNAREVAVDIRRIRRARATLALIPAGAAGSGEIGEPILNGSL